VGVPKKLISQMLVIGRAENTLGLAHLAIRADDRALASFEDAIRIAQPSADLALARRNPATRGGHDGAAAGGSRFMDRQLQEINSNSHRQRARITRAAGPG
jgi:hypothetical protein